MSLRARLRSALITVPVRLHVDELARSLERWLARFSPRVLVIEMHETPTQLREQFRRQLEWVAQHFTPVDLPRFANFWEEPSSVATMAKPPVLFTFDDGRLNNYLVAAPVLESFGARGVFFVVPQWVECAGEESRQFYYSRIDPHPSAQHTHEDWTSMNPAQIRELTERGHTVGSHTYSHVKLAGLTLPELRHEIVDSAARIASWTAPPVEAFAWTFAWDTINREAWNLIRENYRFCFAPCPGTVVRRSDSPHLIWRKEVEVRYSEANLRFMYSSLVDLPWSGKRRRLRNMLLNTARAHA